jgi:hypothetical protein
MAYTDWLGSHEQYHHAHTDRLPRLSAGVVAVSNAPASACLGPFEYRITTSRKDWGEHSPEPDVLYGYTSHRLGLILICPDSSPAMRRTILLHELMHAAAFAAGQLDNRKRREEDWVSMVAPMLLDALRRSPDLTGFLCGRS